MKIKDEYVQPIVLAFSVGLFEARILSDSLIWLFIGWSLGLYVPLIWLMGIIVVIQLIKKKQYKHCVIILCLNIFISSFYDGIFVFTHLGRKTIVYVPYSIQDAKEKGAFICEYKQTNQVVLLDSIDISVDEAFICHLCYYDDKDVLHPRTDLHKKNFVASLKNREQLKDLGKKFSIDCNYQRTDVDAGEWTKIIEIDSISKVPPEDIVFRIVEYVRNDDGSFVMTCVDSICFVRKDIMTIDKL